MDPCFVDPCNGDYHLLSDSACIDAGDPNSEYSNEPWPNGGRVNIGAYGNTSEATRSRDGLAHIGFEVMNKTRVGRTTFEYELALKVQNQNVYDVCDVQMQLIEITDCVTSVIDDSVVIDLIGTGQTVNSIDTFSLTIDRSQLIEPGHLTWELIFYSTNGQQGNQTMNMSLSAEKLDREQVIGDVTGEGEVNITDLQQIIDMWLWTGTAGSISEDVHMDGSIDFKDIAKLAENWMK